MGKIHNLRRGLVMCGAQLSQAQHTPWYFTLRGALLNKQLRTGVVDSD